MLAILLRDTSFVVRSMSCGWLGSERAAAKGSLGTVLSPMRWATCLHCDASSKLESGLNGMCLLNHSVHFLHRFRLK